MSESSCNPNPIPKLRRPPKVLTAKDLLLYDSSSGDGLSMDSELSRHSTRLEKYTYWFSPNFWPKTEVALKLNTYKPRTMVRYLYRRYAMPNSKPLFEALNDSTI